MSKRMFIAMVAATAAAGILLAILINPLWLAPTIVVMAIQMMFILPAEPHDPDSPYPGSSTFSLPKPTRVHKLGFVLTTLVLLGVVIHPALSIFLVVVFVGGRWAIRDMRNPNNAAQ